MAISVPFEESTASKTLYVSTTGSDTGTGSQDDPLRTIQEAVNRATPGTTILVEAGTYVETVKINVSGTPDAPISLISVDGIGAAKIVPDAGTTQKATIAAFGEENIVISGFDVSAGGRLENAIQFGMSGTDFTDMTANIVIKDNIVHDAVKDGIKVSQGDNIFVIDNTVSNVGDQGVDFVAVNNSVIARNDISYVTGTAPALFVKGGSTNVLIAQNHVAHVATDGIGVGGWSDKSWFRPGFTQWEAKNVTVIDNTVEDVGKRAINVLGAQDCDIIHNFLESNPAYDCVVNIAPNNSTPPLNSRNILLQENTFDRSDHWLKVASGQGIGLELVDNRFDGVYQGATGPHSGALDYELPWLPTDGNPPASGNETLTGGTGDDTHLVDTAGDVVLESARGGIDTIVSQVTYALGDNVENLTLAAGAGAIDAVGNKLANQLTGNEAANRLDGGLGADTMTGGTGNDTYVLDSARDRISEVPGEGIDTVESGLSYVLGENLENLLLTGNGKVNATGNDAANVITGNDGVNRLDGKAGDDTMDGGAGNDSYIVDEAGDVVAEILSGAAGGIDLVLGSVSVALSANIENLTLTGKADINGTGNAAANILTGNAGANVLNGKAGADTMIGGAGDDTYVVDDGGDQIKDTAGQDVVRSSVSYVLAAGVERLELIGSGDLAGIGNTSANVMIGNGGDNRLDGSRGADTMDGGAGDDTYVVDNAKDTIVDASGRETVESSVSYGLGAGLEELMLIGRSAINGVGNAGDNKLTGNAGANILDGSTGADTMIGGAGNDTYIVGDASDRVTEDDVVKGGTDTVRSSISYALSAGLENLILTGSAATGATGNDMNNVLTGNDAANVIDGGLGTDKMAGGKGDDIYVVDAAKDAVTEAANAGTDTVQSHIGYVLGANVENLVLFGSAQLDGTGNTLDNRIQGNSGANRLDGSRGADTMIGGGGDDTYMIDNAGDSAVEATSGGTDTVLSTVGFTLGAHVENLTLTGAAAISGAGNALGNLIVGNRAANALDGGAGNDTLDGGLGNDVLVGGAGDDRIDLSGGGNDTVRITSALDGHDILLGFDGDMRGGQDVVDLDALFDALGIDAAARAGRVSVSTANGAVEIAVDADGVAANGWETIVATIVTTDPISVGQDIVVGA